MRKDISKTVKSFGAYIKLNKQRFNLGTFSTEEEARNSYLEAKKIYHIIE